MMPPNWGVAFGETLEAQALSFPFDYNRKIKFETVTRKKTRFGKNDCIFQYFAGLGQ